MASRAGGLDRSDVTNERVQKIMYIWKSLDAGSLGIDGDACLWNDCSKLAELGYCCRTMANEMLIDSIHFAVE